MVILWNQKWFFCGIASVPFGNLIFKKCSKWLTYEVQLGYCCLKTSCQSDMVSSCLREQLLVRISPKLDKTIFTRLNLLVYVGFSADSRAGLVCFDSPVLVWWCSHPLRRDTWAVWFYQRCPDPKELFWAPALRIPSASASQRANPKKHKHSYYSSILSLYC